MNSYLMPLEISKYYVHRQWIYSTNVLIFQSKQSPLHLAAEMGKLEVCETLLQLGIDTNATTDGGQKPIHLAAMNNHSEVVKLFLKTSPELVKTADKVSVVTVVFK